jgi:hypothetical protein
MINPNTMYSKSGISAPFVVTAYRNWRRDLPIHIAEGAILHFSFCNFQFATMLLFVAHQQSLRTPAPLRPQTSKVSISEAARQLIYPTKE